MEEDRDSRKRGADDQGDVDLKRYRQNEHGDDRADVRFLISSKSAGPILGRSGMNVKRLRETFNAKVSIPDAPGPERLLTLSGQEESVFNCAADAINTLADDDGRVEVRYLVHQSQAGCVIGRGGFKIKELRESTKCNLKVYTACCPNSSDRIVSMNGSPDVVVDCLREVYRLLLTAPPKGPVNPYDPNYFDEYASGEYGGWSGMDRGRGGMRGGPGMDRGPPRGMSGGGGYRSSGGGMDRSGGYEERSMGGGYGGSMGGGGRGPPQGLMQDMMPPSRGGGRYMDDRQDGGGGEIQTTQVTIPKDLAGAIIGKGGTRIRDVRQQSKASISIEEAPPGCNERVINISGTAQSIQNAQYLLQLSVKQNSARF